MMIHEEKDVMGSTSKRQQSKVQKGFIVLVALCLALVIAFSSTIYSWALLMAVGAVKELSRVALVLSLFAAFTLWTAYYIKMCMHFNHYVCARKQALAFRYGFYINLPFYVLIGVILALPIWQALIADKQPVEAIVLALSGIAIIWTLRFAVRHIYKIHNPPL
jgi:hypothetical protein